MKYALVVITHGTETSPTIHRSVQSFFEHVDPKPTRCITVIDGPRGGHVLPAQISPEHGGTVLTLGEQQGFCKATAAGWMAGAGSRGNADYVFWLEHDFVFTRRVNLLDLAVALDKNHEVAQMQLMRNPVNAAELEAGGLFESRPDQYTECTTLSLIDGGRKSVGGQWLEQRSYMTTNPCLMRREFMEKNPWPPHPAECEGRFGIDLVGRGYTFGVWGRGEQWVGHIGARDGFGY